MRILTLCAAALLLAGCTETASNLMSGTGSDGASSPRPKTIVVADFVVDEEVLLIDRGYTARLERKIGQFPTHERKPRTMDRVNDEIVAAIIATLREAGLEAQPGAEEGLSASSNAVVVSGRLRATDANAGKNEAGIGGGKSNVTADMTMSTVGGFGKKELLAFSAEPNGKLPSGKAAASNNAEIGNVLAAAGGAKERLSPDVEAVARKLGRAAGDKIVAYARSHGWLTKSDGEEAPAKPEDTKPANKKPTGSKTAQAKSNQDKTPSAKPQDPATQDQSAEPASADDAAATDAQSGNDTDAAKPAAAKPKKKPAP